MKKRSAKKKIHRIPDWRVELYARWLFEKVGKDREWLANWLQHTTYKTPGKLLAEIAESSGSLRKQSIYYSQAMKIFGEHSGLGQLVYNWGFWNEMLQLAEKVLKLGIVPQNPQIIGECALRLIGRVYQERNDFDVVDKYIGLAVEQNTKLNNRWLEAAINIARGRLYHKREYFGAAEQAYRKALQIF